jgi:LPS-assembly lipoprotein
LLIPLLLAGCGLRPLYAGGGNGSAAQTLTMVQVDPVPGKAGWLIHNALVDRLGNRGGTPRYRLTVELDDQVTGFGVRGDNAITRERRTLRARFKLFDATGKQSDAPLLDATAGSDVGIDVVNSEYATVAAEQTALERLSETVADQIVSRLAIFAREVNKDQSGGKTP